MEKLPRPPESKNFSELNFAQLEKAASDISELAKKTWTREGDRFKNAIGKGVSATYVGGVYRPSFSSETFPEFADHIMNHPDSVLHTGSSDKEMVLQAIEEMIEGCGNRVIE